MTNFETITTIDRLAAWVQTILAAGRAAIDTETTSTDPLTADLVGISLAVLTSAAYIPLGHKHTAPQLSIPEALDALRPLLTPLVNLVLHNAVYDILVLRRYGFNLLKANLDDTLLMSYAEAPGPSGHGMDDLAKELLDYDTIRFTDVVLPQLGHETFADVRPDDATQYAAEDAAVTLLLFNHFLADPDFPAKTYCEIDQPLIPILAEMKANGVGIDQDYLASLDDAFRERADTASQEMYTIIGKQINLDSPKELAELLFKERGLTPVRFTDTHQPSTDEASLAILAGQDEVARVIQEHRKFTKLAGTYTSAFPDMLGADGRLHPDVNATLTNTRRFSCSGPNLQNIPVRTKEGASIRAAFVAPEGSKILSADYSQIELRVLAQITEEDFLLDAYRRGADIHRATAALVFGVPEDEVTDAQRRAAKTVVFAVLYGQGPAALAAALGWSVDQARRFIATYFSRLPKVDGWMQLTRTKARVTGQVETIFGSVLPVPNILSNDDATRSYGERQAVNFSVQGSAADLMRLAMPAVRNLLRERRRPANLLLTVHDELLLEVPDDHVEPVRRLVIAAMERAADHLVEWKLPIKVEAKVAQNWKEAH